MNETLIKEIIRCKLHFANMLVEQLPPKASEKVRKTGRIILEGLNEGMQEIKEQPDKQSESSKKLNSVPIE